LITAGLSWNLWKPYSKKRVTRSKQPRIDSQLNSAGAIKLNAANITLREERNASAQAVQAGQYVQISIHDQGIGIPEEDLSTIFDLYFTTKEKGSQKGMGFGLAIAYSIIKKHGGHITVDSKVGAGSTFHVYLPVLNTSK